MFRGCFSLKIFSIKRIEYLASEEFLKSFENCFSIIDLHLNGYNITKVKYIDYMFSGCSSLKDISAIEGWNLSIIEDFLIYLVDVPI